MIPVQTLETFDIFGDPSTQVSPAPAKYAQGYLPGEVLPAQHENFFLGKSSRCVTQLRDGLSSIENELVNIVIAGGATPDASTNNQVLTAINYLIAAAEARAKLAAHPKGELWWTSEPPTITVEGVEQPNPEGDPQLLFGGGTWVRIKDAFVWAAGDNDTVTKNVYTYEDGSLSVSLSTDNLPEHKHNVSKSFTHGHNLWVYGGGQESISNVYGFSTPASNRTGASGTYATRPSYNTSGSPYVEVITINLSATSDNNTTSHTNVNITPSRIKRFCWQRTA